MCGLVGVAGDTTGKVKDIFTELLLIDSVRGMHSTGLGTVKRHDNAVDILKQPGPTHFLLCDPRYKKVVEEFGLKCIIGHNRHATVGAHTIENAHPFGFTDIMGAHNGTLDSWSRKKLFNADKFGTDSEAIFSNIQQFGIEATVDNLEGAWALTWFDSKTNTINMLRNDKRPLFYCYSKDRCTLFWASEKPMLQYALARHHKEPTLDPEGKPEFFIVDVDTLCRWEIPDTIQGKFTPPVKTAMKGPEPAPYVYSGYAYGGKHGNYSHSSKHGSGSSSNVLPFQPQTHQQKNGKNTGPPSTGMLFETRRDTKKFRPPYKNGYGGILNKKDFNRLVSTGCVFCEDNSSEWGEFIQPLRDNDGVQAYLCEPCYNDDDIFNLCRHLI